MAVTFGRKLAKRQYLRRGFQNLNVVTDCMVGRGVHRLATAQNRNMADCGLCLPQSLKT